MSALLITALPANSLAVCQHCVHEYWSCLWAAKQRRTSCLANASSQAERDQCWEDYDDDVYWCEAEYRWCAIYFCDA